MPKGVGPGFARKGKRKMPHENRCSAKGSECAAPDSQLAKRKQKSNRNTPGLEIAVNHSRKGSLQILIATITMRSQTATMKKMTVRTRSAAHENCLWCASAGGARHPASDLRRSRTAPEFIRLEGKRGIFQSGGFVLRTDRAGDHSSRNVWIP
jgi:hypothetical protein